MRRAGSRQPGGDGNGTEVLPVKNIATIDGGYERNSARSSFIAWGKTAFENGVGKLK